MTRDKHVDVICVHSKIDNIDDGCQLMGMRYEMNNE